LIELFYTQNSVLLSHWVIRQIALRLYLHDSTSRWGYRPSAYKATRSLSSFQWSAAVLPVI